MDYPATSRSLRSDFSVSSATEAAPSTDTSTQPNARRTAEDHGAVLEEPDSYSIGHQRRKDKVVPDWYVEGPGRRVGYEDLTAIDWIYEYTKERQRLRKLVALDNGLIGHLRQLFDASHVWLVLVASGISVGCVAAFINIASDWLGDIKTGYCKSGAGGGQFYLNKQFCCWGHDDFSQCQDWTPWPLALGIGSVGGQYVISYIYFVVFSVCISLLSPLLLLTYC